MLWFTCFLIFLTVFLFNIDSNWLALFYPFCWTSTSKIIFENFFRIPTWIILRSMSRTHSWLTRNLSIKGKITGEKRIKTIHTRSNALPKCTPQLLILLLLSSLLFLRTTLLVLLLTCLLIWT